MRKGKPKILNRKIRGLRKVTVGFNGVESTWILQK